MVLCFYKRAILSVSCWFGHSGDRFVGDALTNEEARAEASFDAESIRWTLPTRALASGRRHCPASLSAPFLLVHTPTSWAATGLASCITVGLRAASARPQGWGCLRATESLRYLCALQDEHITSVIAKDSCPKTSPCAEALSILGGGARGGGAAPAGHAAGR